MKFVVLSLIIHTSYGAEQVIPVTSERFDSEVSCTIRGEELVPQLNLCSIAVQMEEGFDTSVNFSYRCD